MSKPIIEVSNISKSYTISHQHKARYGSLRDGVTTFLQRPFLGKNQTVASEMTKETFWALKDVSFTVGQGEIFGVVGKNGSGKSTLLKVLSRIIEPTSGRAVLHGRVASLLEVGTGFHPELTGRENIFFNGSMLGMSRDEIGKKFDEIVHFSEIERFLDTPVKFYSSGMYVRLAFSVAAHLDSEVLILDEVLSVGDAAFQQKSMNKVLSTMEQGKTVLFVSHSMESVRKLCNRGLLLKDGEVAFIGDTDTLVGEYTKALQTAATPEKLRTTWENNDTVDNEHFVPHRVYVTNEQGKKITAPTLNNTDHWIVIEADVKKPSELLTFGYSIHNSNNMLIYLSYPTDVAQEQWVKLKKGRVVLRGKIPKHLLNADTYKISVVGGLHNKFWLFDPDANNPSVQFGISGGLSESPYWKHPRSGVIAPVIDWEVMNA